MKKTIVVLAVVALAVSGCKKKEEAPKGVAPQGGAPTGEMPKDATHGGDPHAGLKPQEVPPGAGHKGKVLNTMDSGGYTYIEVDENGQKLWVATMQTKVKPGDIVEFADTPPMINFQSKTLKRTFDKIIFASGIRVSK